MRLRGDITVEYLADTGVLQFTGMSAAGVKKKIEFPVGSPREFFMAMGAALQSGEKGPDNTDHLIPMRQFIMGTAQNAETLVTDLLMLQVGVADFQLRFGAPLSHLESDKIPAIEQHLQASAEPMAHGVPSLRHR